MYKTRSRLILPQPAFPANRYFLSTGNYSAPVRRFDFYQRTLMIWGCDYHSMVKRHVGWFRGHPPLINLHSKSLKTAKPWMPLKLSVMSTHVSLIYLFFWGFFGYFFCLGAWSKFSSLTPSPRQLCVHMHYPSKLWCSKYVRFWAYALRLISMMSTCYKSFVAPDVFGKARFVSWY